MPEFYGELFGWTFERDAAPDYTLIQTTPGAPGTVARAEELGGKVLVAPTAFGSGLVFAHLLDRDGNHFEVYQPAPEPHRSPDAPGPRSCSRTAWRSARRPRARSPASP